MHNDYIFEADLLRQRVSSANSRGQVISAATARGIAAWLAGGVGPGLRTFAATGEITGELYTELTRLYEQRRPEVEGWLDALARYGLQQLSADRRVPPTTLYDRGQGTEDGR